MNYIRTLSGQKFTFPPSPEYRYTISEVYQALRRLNRFTGHSGSYNVAAHSIGVAKFVYTVAVRNKAKPALINRLVIRALLHDAPEAYLGDISSPLKRALPPEFNRVYNSWHETVLHRMQSQLAPGSVTSSLGLSEEDCRLAGLVKKADQTLLGAELRKYLGGNEEDLPLMLPSYSKLADLCLTETSKGFVRLFRQACEGKYDALKVQGSWALELGAKTPSPRSVATNNTVAAYLLYPGASMGAHVRSPAKLQNPR